MISQLSPAQRNDGRLWAAAFGLSLALNAVIVLMAGFSILQLEKYQPTRVVVTAPAETLKFIAPELAKPPPKPAANPADPAIPVPPTDPAFARTSEDQRGKRPDQPAFIGERDTEATSNTTPDPTAPAMPAQAGIEPRRGEIETTESRYQDGELVPDSPLTPDSPMPPAPLAPKPSPLPPATAKQGQDSPTPGTADQLTTPPPPDTLATSPHPVDIPIPKPTTDENPKPGPPQLPKEGQPDAPPNPNDIKEAKAAPQLQDTPKPPAFRGYQRKTVIQGSISRTGRSALDVEDSPLGRYQATISRAVELEWQRNCVRYRDFITPGFLTVRFFVDAKGKVRNVDFVGAMQTGQQQKGFTLNSIRDAAIPAMPAELKKDFQEEPLELIFNFYF